MKREKESALDEDNHRRLSKKKGRNGESKGVTIRIKVKEKTRE